MPDVWSMVGELDAATRDASPRCSRRAAPIRNSRRCGARFSPTSRSRRARTCSRSAAGRGVLSRALARWPGVNAVVGVDTAPSLLDKARELAADLPNVAFTRLTAGLFPSRPQLRCRHLRFDAFSRSPARGCPGQAFRVLRPAGWLGIFDGDYATTTVALGDHDPLQACVYAMLANSVHDRWLVRRLPALVRGCGFEVVSFRSHGFVETTGGYMVTIVERGADILRGLGQIDEEHGGRTQVGGAAAVASGNILRAHRLCEPRCPQAIVTSSRPRASGVGQTENSWFLHMAKNPVCST